MNKTDNYIGSDVHQDTIMVAIAESGRDGHARHYGSISSDLLAIKKPLRLQR